MSPEQTRKLFAEALAFQQAHQFDEAAGHYERLLELSGPAWQVHFNLGVVRQAQGRHAEAIRRYQDCLRLRADFAPAHNNLGNALRAIGNRIVALKAYQAALLADPGLLEAHFNFAELSAGEGRHDLATKHYSVVTQRDAGNEAAWDGLFRSATLQGDSEGAASALLRWRAACAPSPRMVIAALTACRGLADREMESRFVELALDWPFREDRESLGTAIALLAYFDVTREALYGLMSRYSALWPQPRGETSASRRESRRQLRIGYLSGDFRDHVMGRLMVEVIERHDRQNLEIVLLSLRRFSPSDPVTCRFTKAAHSTVDLSALNDEQAAEVIRSNDIDVLVDLGGLTDGGRPALVSLKPARVSISHLASHSATGMPFSDGRTSDAVVDPGDAGEFQVEPVLRLDSCVLPLIGKAVQGDAYEGQRRALGLEGRTVIGAFANLMKLSPRCLALWKKVLDRIPRGVLLFSPFSDRDRPSIDRLMAATGIGHQQYSVLVADRSSPVLNLRYRLVDLVLDTVPYNGGDTSLAALGMGVPLVTLAGTRQCERVGASILTHLGVPELIAGNEDEFIEIACRLATDREHRQLLSTKVFTKMSPVDDHAARHARSLESLYRRLASPM